MPHRLSFFGMCSWLLLEVWADLAPQYVWFVFSFLCICFLINIRSLGDYCVVSESSNYLGKETHIFRQVCVLVVGVYAQQTGRLPGCLSWLQSELSLSWRALPHAGCPAVCNITLLPFVKYIKVDKVCIVNNHD